MRPFDLRLLREVPESRRPVLALGAVGVASGVATVATAFALSAVVVAVVERRPVTGPVLWLLALFAARAALSAATESVGAMAGVRVSTALRSALLRRWSHLDADSRPDPTAAATLATAGASAVEPYAARFLPALVTAAVVPGLAVATLLVVDWPSAVVVALTLPLLPLFAALIGRATADATDRRWAALRGLSGHFLDVVRGLPTLVGYGRAERQVEVVHDVSARHRRATMRTLRLAFLSSAALELLATLSVALVAVTVGLRLSHGSMPLGAGLVAILLAPEAYWPVRRVGAEFHTAADGSVALTGILDELSPDAGEPAGAARPDPRGGLSLRGVTYAHPGSSVAVLRDLDLDAGPGLTVVVGPSGCGKSTLLELVAGLRRPVSGAVRAAPAHLLTQRPFLAAGTVRESLTVAHPATDGELWSALRAVGADGVVAALPRALDTPLGDDGAGLSAGQRQRLALARAVLAPEPVLLLDEPTAHVDADSVAPLVDLVVRLARDRTVVTVTHTDELLARADHVVRLHPAREAATA
ncbi:thiol reductant ABC exporter subunit CydD [Terracoccus luteus]|uniref:Thiol reductant ABC exporter CydD subunit n=1 Tax=Terracoccus luteus TaxID=53356 RepID=A0A839Q382_9MICO|nr:thiol reductant ABC exporter subunit CydD [Terracoccus luteus]MBB2987592.1 thiol reductant ABC exporter CydD subunit [Terracoccus luteus]MCP2173243.1 thiol reductant ABC exporter CydD subunit [Terracoccus luteus]